MKYAHIRNKEITITEIKNLVVSRDSIDTIRFCIPKIYNDINLTMAVFHCKFQLPSGSGDLDLLVTEVSPDGTLIYADWDVRGNATTENGKVQIQIIAVLGEDTWQSKPATIIVESSLSPEELGEFTPTVLEQYLVLFQALIPTTQESTVKFYILSESYCITSITYDGSGAIESAVIVYPDGKNGAFSNIVEGTFGITSIDYLYDGTTYVLTVTYDDEGNIATTNLEEEA